MIYEVRIPVEKFTHSAMSAVGGYRTGPVRGCRTGCWFFRDQGIVSTSGLNKSSISIPV